VNQAPSSDVVLICAPIGADARNISGVLRQAGHSPKICVTVAELAQKIQDNCGAIVLTEETLTPELMATLADVFRAQPPWSDVPIVLISSTGTESRGAALTARLKGPHRTVALLERPLRSATLLATLDSLLVARRRQYEVRDLLHERDLLLSSLESRVAERTAELRRMIEEMEAFSYSVSHDLRSPLRSLAGYAQVLQEDHAEELSPTARSYLERIRRAAERMDRLTQDVLAYTRVTQCEMTIEPLNLDEVLDDVLDQYPELAAPPNRIRIHRPLGHVLGPVPSLIPGFSNLLGNAVKFVPPDRHPEIDVQAVAEGEWRQVSIRDNGIGIEAAHQQRIFRMFERVADKELPGTGIGLAIAKKAVERMGGTIGVRSSFGSGAEFWIRLRTAGGMTEAETSAAYQRRGSIAVP
jgi:signal transduction histidine kinase